MKFLFLGCTMVTLRSEILLYMNTSLHDMEGDDGNKTGGEYKGSRSGNIKGIAVEDEWKRSGTDVKHARELEEDSSGAGLDERNRREHEGNGTGRAMKWIWMSGIGQGT